MPADARESLLKYFEWVDGHADIWRLFRDPDALRAVVDALAAPYADREVTAVVAIESRGFLLGGAAAIALGVGFVPVRKTGSMFPGDKASVLTAPDYRGLTGELRMRRDLVRTDDRLLLVDDWAETGSQAVAVQQLVAMCGAGLVGISLVVDELPDAVRATLPEVSCILRADELP